MPHKDDMRPHYLSAGERALILRSLNVLVHEQHMMIQEAWTKYKKSSPATFEDHKQHSMNQIAACDALIQRIRTGDIFNPEGSA